MIRMAPKSKLKYKKEAVFVTFMRDPTQRVMSQWRSDSFNLPDLFKNCKSFDALFAKVRRYPLAPSFCARPLRLGPLSAHAPLDPRPPRPRAPRSPLLCASSGRPVVPEALDAARAVQRLRDAHGRRLQVER